MAYSNLDVRNGGSGCLLWFDELVDMREVSENGQDIYIRMASSELGKHPSLFLNTHMLVSVWKLKSLFPVSCRPVIEHAWYKFYFLDKETDNLTISLLLVGKSQKREMDLSC